MAAEAAAAEGVSVFPDGVLQRGGGSRKVAANAAAEMRAVCRRAAMVRNQIDRWWNKVEQRHERSAIGSLITPEIFISGLKFCRRSFSRTWDSTSTSWARSTFWMQIHAGRDRAEHAADAPVSWIDSCAHRATEKPDAGRDAHCAGRAEPGRR